MPTPRPAADLIARARTAGADQADAVLLAGASLTVQRQAGKTEQVERSEGRDLGLRVFVGQPGGHRLVQRRSIRPVSRSWRSAPWRWRGWCPRIPTRGLADNRRTARAGRARPGRTRPSRPPNSCPRVPRRPRRRRSPWRHHQFGRCRGRFQQDAQRSGHLGGVRRPNRHAPAIRSPPPRWQAQGTAMQRDYDYSSTVHLADLDDPAAIGCSARRARGGRLNPDADRRRPGCLSSMIRVSRWPARPSAGAINGASRRARHDVPEGQARPAHLRRRGQRCFDDPRRVRGFALPPIRWRGNADRRPGR